MSVEIVARITRSTRRGCARNFAAWMRHRSIERAKGGRRGLNGMNLEKGGESVGLSRWRMIFDRGRSFSNDFWGEDGRFL